MIRKLSFANGINTPMYIDEQKQLLALYINLSMRCGEVNRHD
jgi:hypothetical protein